MAAANNSGVWNEQGDVLELSIAPAYGVGGRLEIWTKRDTGTELDLTIPAGAAYGTLSGASSWFRRPFRSHTAPDGHDDM